MRVLIAGPPGWADRATLARVLAVVDAERSGHVTVVALDGGPSQLVDAVTARGWTVEAAPPDRDPLLRNERALTAAPVDLVLVVSDGGHQDPALRDLVSRARAMRVLVVVLITWPAAPAPVSSGGRAWGR